MNLARRALWIVPGGLVIVLTLAHCSGSVAGSDSVGTPCVLADEADPRFAGFNVTEESIETGSSKCGGGVCLANHFQGRVSCPLGQDGLDLGGLRKSCTGPKDTSCGAGQACVAASTLAPQCTTDMDCSAVPSTHCDKVRKLCVCVSGGVAPMGYFCDSDSTLKSYVCHAPGNCQAQDAVAKDNLDKSGNPKDCCIPGTDTPVEAPVCGQCDSKKGRNAEQAVYCSCRCGPPDGTAAAPGDTFCACPVGFQCAEIRKDIGIGDPHLPGKYCIKEGTAYDGNPFSCGVLADHSHFDATCHGTAPLQ